MYGRARILYFPIGSILENKIKKNYCVYNFYVYYREPRQIAFWSVYQLAAKVEKRSTRSKHLINSKFKHQMCACVCGHAFVYQIDRMNLFLFIISFHISISFDLRIADWQCGDVVLAILRIYPYHLCTMFVCMCQHTFMVNNKWIRQIDAYAQHTKWWSHHCHKSFLFCTHKPYLESAGEKETERRKTVSYFPLNFFHLPTLNATYVNGIEVYEQKNSNNKKSEMR